jgi:PKD repeat protein
MFHRKTESNSTGGCGMRKLLTMLAILLLLVVTACPAGFGNNLVTTEIIREIRASVNQAGQKFEVMVPEYPLEFDTTVNWDLAIDKKGLASEKEAAYLAIESANSNQKKTELQTLSQKGVLAIPKGSQYKMTLFAGEYTRLFQNIGAGVSLKLTYPEILVHYAPADQPFTYDLELQGPNDVKNWKWLWTNAENSTGKKVTHRFDGEGAKTVVLETVLSGEKNRKFHFEMNVLPLIVSQPVVGPLQGACDLNVKASVSSTLNYDQKAVYTWDFGNGVGLEGEKVEYTYLNPGKYNIVLATKIADLTYTKNWVVDVAPLSVKPNVVVMPLTGPTPLEVTGNLNPTVQGGPTELKFIWEVGGKTYETNSFQHLFDQPGEYSIILKTVDKLHSETKIQPETFTVRVTPPVLNLKPEVSAAQGVIPVSVTFNPNTTVQGSPVALKYWWDFGDGSFSEQEKPTHIYKTPGDYQVRLVVNDASHPGNLVTADLKVKVLPPELKVSINSNVSKGTVPLRVNFGAQIGITGSPCEPVYCWNFGDGATSADQNPAHIYWNEGTYTVTLELKDRINSANSVKATAQIVTKLPALRLTASLTPTSGAAPLNVKCQAWGEREGNSNPKLKYEWNFNDGETLNGADVSHTFNTPGTYQVTVTMSDEELDIKERKRFKVTVK